jgi:ribonuclease-3
MLVNVSQQFLLHSDLQDPKSHLQEWSQGRKLGIPQYITVRTSGPDHERTYEVEVQINGKVFGRGTGQSKQVATRHAAQSALDTIEKT